MTFETLEEAAKAQDSYESFFLEFDVGEGVEGYRQQMMWQAEVSEDVFDHGDGDREYYYTLEFVLREQHCGNGRGCFWTNSEKVTTFLSFEEMKADYEEMAQKLNHCAMLSNGQLLGR